MKHRFQPYIVRMEILSTFHTGVEYISWLTIHHSAHSNEWWRKCRKMLETMPETAPSLEEHGPPSNTSIPGPTLLTTPNGSLTSSHLPRNYATKAPLDNGNAHRHTDRQTDTQTKVKTVYPPVSLRSLGRYNKVQHLMLSITYEYKVVLGFWLKTNV